MKAEGQISRNLSWLPRYGMRDARWVFAVFFIGGIALAVAIICIPVFVLGAAAFAVRGPLSVLPQAVGALAAVVFAAMPKLLVLELAPQFVSALGAYATFAVFKRVPLSAVLSLFPFVVAAAVVGLQWHEDTKYFALDKRGWLQIAIVCAALQLPVTLTCWWLVRKVGRSEPAIANSLSSEGAAL